MYICQSALAPGSSLADQLLLLEANKQHTDTIATLQVTTYYSYLPNLSPYLTNLPLPWPNPHLIPYIGRDGPTEGAAVPGQGLP